MFPLIEARPIDDPYIIRGKISTVLVKIIH
jgi:hypothetical protein